MRVSVLCLLCCAWACVADPIGPDGDLSTGDLAGSDLGGATRFTVSWEPRGAGITGLRTTSIQTYDDQFFIGTPTSGVFHMTANDVLPQAYIAAPSVPHRLVYAFDGQPVVSVMGGLMRASTMNGAWQSFRGTIPSANLALLYVESMSNGFALVEGDGLFRSPLSEGMPFSFVRPAADLSSIARRTGDTVYLPLGALGLISYDVTSATTNLTVSGTGINALSATAVVAGTRTLVGGVKDGATKVFQVTDLASSPCGEALTTGRSVTALATTGPYNLAVLDDNSIYTNLDCASAWTLRRTFGGVFRAVAIAPNNQANITVLVGTQHTLFLSNDFGQTLRDVELPSNIIEIESITSNPANPNHVVVGTDGRGIWESRDAGATWNRLDPTRFGPELRLSSTFSAADTLLIAGRYQASGVPTGGVVRGEFANGEWTFEKLGNGTPSEAPFSVIAALASPTLGIIACFPGASPLMRWTGATWTNLLAVPPAECTALSTRNDGTVHYVGATGSVTIVTGTDIGSLTTSVVTLPAQSPVRTILPMSDGRLLVGTDAGAYLVTGGSAAAILMGGFALGPVGALLEDRNAANQARWWIASAVEPLLVSLDGEQWERVETTGIEVHPSIRDLKRIGDSLYAASSTSVWRATFTP